VFYQLPPLNVGIGFHFDNNLFYTINVLFQNLSLICGATTFGRETISRTMFNILGLRRTVNEK
jgi:hypothetical protein